MVPGRYATALVGFKGAYVVYRGDQPLTKLVGRGSDLLGAGSCEGPWYSDWQVWRVFGWPEDLPVDLLPELRNATKAPVLAGEFWDDSAVHVKGLGLRTPPWQVWLKLDGVLGYMLTPPAPFDEDDNFLGEDWTDPEYEREVEQLRRRLLAAAPGGLEGAHKAVNWATEAGLQTLSPAEIAETIDRDEDFSQDIFDELLARLGVGPLE
ncbi:hypothetical protein GCM10023191_071100 [Actinoallomurus oryzae]|uniref:Uncharacterized protein n=1 Tax=Actinoallomurus oryzae TaxID=502180 RepID=A0ABP8QT24_9ACTN